MKNYGFLFATFLFLFGCTQQPTEADKANAENAIKGFYSAAEKFDFETMRSYCTPEFHAIEDGHTYTNIDEMIEMAKSFEGFNMQFNLDIVSTEMGHDMAMAIVKFDAHFKKDQTDMNLKTIENYLIKKVEGKWLIDFFQSTYLTDAKKLEKGALLGIHILSDIELKPGVSSEQVEDFLLNKYIPAFNKLAEDFKMIPLKGIRGIYADKLAFIMYLQSDDVRNSYWSAEGVFTTKGQELFQKMQSLTDERDKLFTYRNDPYTDWRVE